MMSMPKLDDRARQAVNAAIKGLVGPGVQKVYSNKYSNKPSAETTPDEAEAEAVCQLCCSRVDYICMQPDGPVHYALCCACGDAFGKGYCVECVTQGIIDTAISMRLDWASWRRS